ncbi:putative protein phosphatase 2C-like protein 44 [Lathyrus oleraceus]|uniref:PPM-type phosphatase domain-containing protein n=1 Tax=Pisum sativum TaxID=3888 RepID=A0A9D5A7K8_PEA|nr:putative protein phosphatase 2C-like protein 44 [Pisum sativum]KAI5397448.1 hypothetical protein KIW84_063314 [Pisum sativum]
MGMRDFRIKIKALRVKLSCLGKRSTRRNHEVAGKPSWMTPISHGHHAVKHDLFEGDDSDDYEFDSVVVQREQIGDAELWYFGIFDPVIGDCVTKYLKFNFFDKKLKETHLARKAKETLKRAYLGAKAKIRETQKSEESCLIGSTSVMIINGEKLVLANIGDYRTVLCKDGVAHQTHGRYNHPSAKKHWYHRLFSGGNATATKYSKASELVVGGYYRIDSSTEFVILASNGIWEVMKNQEAVNLIRHIEDPQEAAECLAKEALVRRSKGNISCLIIRFD